MGQVGVSISLQRGFYDPAILHLFGNNERIFFGIPVKNNRRLITMVNESLLQLSSL
jgi:hypothetical protein